MTGLRWLAAEAFSDALRRRIVPVICALALVSLLFVDSCTGCAPAVRDAQGRLVELPQLAGYGGMAMLGLLGLWIAILAGVLASDHLAEPLADGSASLLLARPVSRDAYALARLLGAWGLAALTGAGLLLAAAFLLHSRQGLAAGPALLSTCLALANAYAVAGLAMALSLGLGRTLTSLAVFAGVGLVAGVEALQLAGVALEPWLRALANGAPPLLAGVVAPLAHWLPPEMRGDAGIAGVAIRALTWAGAGTAALILAFRRVELGR